MGNSISTVLFELKISDMNVSKTLSELAVIKASETAIIFNDKQFTYGNINTIANSLASYLAEKGIKRGDSIAVILP
ncbi:MAG: hypothetical protein KAS29_18020, partial [Bacteroidales bacterium]|nr:hypothetical protein [Bacteroidales bacterium]